MRGQTRAPCPATTYLSSLSCEPKRWPLACENLPLRRLTPLEVVWRLGDPPVHYRPGVRARAAAFARRQDHTPGGPKTAGVELRYPPSQICELFPERVLFR